MSAKTSSTAQPPGRRTPLSLNTTTKQINKPTNDKESNKKEKESITNNQKTEIAKKDSQSERTDKKSSLTDSRRPSSSSGEIKKSEEVKTTKNEENKKNQNGVDATNGVKDKEKPNTSGNVNKLKHDILNIGSSSPKKDANDKKKETVVPQIVAKETKNDDNKIKVDEKKKEKSKPNDDSTKNLDEKKKEEVKEVLAKKKTDEKPPSEQKAATVKVSDKVKVGQAAEKSDIIDLDSSEENSSNGAPTKEKKNTEKITARTPMKEKKVEEKITSRTPPVKEKKIEETPKPEEKSVQSPVEPLPDVEMLEPLNFADEPSTNINAASTPAKIYNRTEVYTNRFEEPQKKSPKSDVCLPMSAVQYTPDRKISSRAISKISGRRSIREFTFKGNVSESYRQVNTELDFTTSSMNVTVGSEVPNNDSYLGYYGSRKRDRSSLTRQTPMDVQSDLSPKSPKRAKIDFGMTGFFNAMASPITLLRARLSRATVQSTPKKRDGPEASNENLVERALDNSVAQEINTTEDLTFNPDIIVDESAIDADEYPECEEPAAKCSHKPAVDEDNCEDDDIQIKETITTTDSQAKKKCILM